MRFEMKSQQIKLSQSQIEAFYIDCFNESQVKDFITLTNKNQRKNDQVVVDIGGGVGFFAQNLNKQTGYKVRVIDSDKISIDSVKNLNNSKIEGIIGDALTPDIKGDEDIVCFNLILHHLIGATETETRLLQKQALLAWKNSNSTIFVNEYIYESFVGNLSGRLIYEITSSKVLSAIGRTIGKIIPSMRANTFGIGVRFRAHREWLKVFEECGFQVSSVTFGEIEHTAFPLRLLLIKQVRRDSFLLVKPTQQPLLA